MGEARAKKRRDHLALVKGGKPPLLAPQVEVVEVETIYLMKVQREQIRRRYERVERKFPTYQHFLLALILAGVEVFDNEFSALDAHVRGESKPLEPAGAPAEAPLIAEPGSLSKDEIKALVIVSPTGYIGKRTENT